MRAARRDSRQHWVFIGNPENRRVTLFQQALQRFELPPATVVPWLDVIEDRVEWPAVLGAGAILRIDSPGENFAVERALIAAGAEAPGARISSAQACALPEDHGRILYPRQWYLGFSSVLRRLDVRLRECAAHRRLQSSDDILTMFDKVGCQRRLAAAGIPVAPILGEVASFDELISRMMSAGVDRVFVKLAHGSSASGVVAFERSGTRLQAHTSAELVRSCGEVRLYNSLKVRRYSKAEDIAALIDTLARERVQVEAWLPKASIGGVRFDLRVVVIGGRAQHVVVRCGRSPMTNLHLGNARGDVESVSAAMGEAAWSDALQTCERAMNAFSATQYAGIDLLIRNDFARHAVLEVNAFGDLLPRVLHQGFDTYEAEIASVAPRLAVMKE